MTQIVQRRAWQAAALRLCDAHGTSLLTLAGAVTGDPEVAEHLTVRAIVELSSRPDLCDSIEAAEQRRELCWYVFRQAARSRPAVRADPSLPAGVLRLRAVPALSRLAIVLCVFGGHTLRQVADLLDLPELEAAALLRDGLHQLRQTRLAPID